MKQIKIRAEHDSCNGEVMLFIEGVEPSDEHPVGALEGRLIAHDLLEHVDGIPNIGSIQDELQALGAVIYVRGFNGMLGNAYYTPEESLASDVAEMARQYAWGDEYLIDPPESFEEHIDTQYDDFITAVIEKAKETTEYEDFDENARSLDDFWPTAAALLMQGYLKAEAKYEDHSVSYAFQEIAKAVDSIAKYVEYEGQEWLLTYDYDGWAKIDEVEPEWEDEEEYEEDEELVA